MANNADSENSALLGVENDAPESLEPRGNSSPATSCDEGTRVNNVKAKEKPFSWPFALSLFIIFGMVPLVFELIFPFVSE